MNMCIHRIESCFILLTKQGLLFFDFSNCTLERLLSIHAGLQVVLMNQVTTRITAGRAAEIVPALGADDDEQLHITILIFYSRSSQLLLIPRGRGTTMRLQSSPEECICS